MGIFDWLKGKPEQRRGSMPRDMHEQSRFTLKDVVSAFWLKEKEPYEPSIPGTWWEGSSGVTRFAVQEINKKLFVHIGTIAEVTDIYLTRISDPSRLPPDNSPSRLDRIVNSHPVCRQFVLAAYPSEEFDFPKLRNAGVLDNLSRLSDAVKEVMIYENYLGVTIVLEGVLTRAEFERDLSYAIEMQKAIAA